jgi:alpha-beta hydrolase superfamily lysophospholipase
VSATPRWFGPSDRPLFGWFHLPDDGQARCWAIVCPPLGYEAIGTHFTLRKLCEGLAASGVAVLRFDYDGTGDSTGRRDDPCRVAAWRASVGHAVATARAIADLPVVLVGERMGAALAALTAAEDGAIAGVALWDPCVKGRSFLRQEHALMRIVTGVEARPDGVVETMGYAYSPETVADLHALDVAHPDLPPLADEVLVLWRPERSRDAELEAKLAADGTSVVNGVAENQDEMFMREHFPLGTVSQILEWTSQFGGPPRSIGTSDLPGVDHVSLGGSGTGRSDVVERAMALGPVGLFGILAEPSEGASGPVVLFFNFGINHHEGPGGLWVDLSRRWAAGGLRCLRVDRSGIGESGVRPGQSERQTFPPEAVEDVQEIARAVSPEDPSNVVLIGVCAGAYLAVEGGIGLSARGVCAINPVVTFVPAEFWTGQEDPGRQAVRSKRSWLRRPWVHSRLARLIKPYIPWQLWWLLDKLRIQPSPGSGFEPLVERGVDTLVICDGMDAGPYRDRSPWVLKKLGATGKFDFEVYHKVDHLLLTQEFQQYVERVLTEYVIPRFGPSRVQPSMKASR